MNLESTVLDAQGYRFDALTTGPEDGELVLFLHGFPEFADSWLGILPSVAQAGFRTVAVNQRGYSPGARPQNISGYAVDHLIADIGGFADALGRQRFHVVGHDWGALLAWVFAAKHPERVQSLCVLSTPHPDALFDAIEKDPDQQKRSEYFSFFRAPGGIAEAFFQADDYARLRQVYQGKLSGSRLNDNIRRLAEPGTLTAALNWYRALDLNQRVGKVSVPVLYVWSTADMALGKVAALATAQYVTGSFRFEKLEGVSHWIPAETPAPASALILLHLHANSSTATPKVSSTYSGHVTLAGVRQLM